MTFAMVASVTNNSTK